LKQLDIPQQRCETLKKLFNSEMVQFRLGVTNHDGFPLEEIPEVCFAGRSNVGKSSLINAITNRHGLARASNTPGRTQELNYFSIADKLHLVDLPGYGFAEAPKKKVEIWNLLIRDYMQGRRQLRRVFVLIDARHGIKELDKEIFEMLDKAGVNYQVTFTKTDKISQSALDKIVHDATEICKKFIAVHPRFLITSSEKRYGLDTVRHEIANFIPEYYLPDRDVSYDNNPLAEDSQHE
jgi:GTP-binding protein